MFVKSVSGKKNTCLRGLMFCSFLLFLGTTTMLSHNWPSAFPDVEPSVSIHFPRCVLSLGLARSAAQNTHGEGAEVVMGLPCERAFLAPRPAHSWCGSQPQSKEDEGTGEREDPREKNPTLAQALGALFQDTEISSFLCWHCIAPSTMCRYDYRTFKKIKIFFNYNWHTIFY